MKQPAKYIYILLVIMVVFPIDLLGSGISVAPWFALFLGIVFALFFECPYPKFNKKTSKYLLQASVVGLGFGMNLTESLKSGSEGMLFTVVSVVGVMVIGVLAGYWLHINRKTSYLISSGTAICGGSAIAAVGPVLKADDHEMAVSLGVVFVLNAIALFIFPPIGAYFDMSAAQFGTWAAIAIHDTSSVVGAGDAYSGMLAAQGVENAGDALKLATLIKLTRALWIIPLALVTMLIFRDKKSKISIPWFIFLFILAMVINTYLPLPAWLTSTLVYLAKKGLVLTLFMIGAGLSVKMVKAVGVKPFVLAIMLWIIIGVSSFFVVMNTIA
ncbi:YeiH family protein [uncultured Duncaniella sp.]|uniref:YeiH family protein n=2 Tax=uncultured Duncaniella sp. TaxID=2768039 RepID=UPI00350FB672|nr:putative sulfate exporter family transporter [Muribaculaceae bacterium]